MLLVLVLDRVKVVFVWVPEVVWGLLDGPASTMISPCFCRDEEWARERDGKIYIRKEQYKNRGRRSSNFHEDGRESTSFSGREFWTT